MSPNDAKLELGRGKHGLVRTLESVSRYWQQRQFWWHLVTGCLIVLFLYLFVVNAWIVDESYITFRTIDNFLHGYGLVWNVGERVQVYTHPLWMFVMAFAASMSSEFYFTAIVVSLIFSLAVVAVAGWLFYVSPAASQKPMLAWKMPLFMLLLCCSKAYIDFSTSGLENPLSHFLVALFVLCFLEFVDRRGVPSELDLFWLILIASYCVFNRLDTVLLFLPVLVYGVLRSAPKLRLRLLRPLLIGTLPVTVWLLFSIVYYGFPFPNTYYAKLASSGAGFQKKLEMGIDYFANGIHWDMVTQLVFIIATIVTIRSRRTPLKMIMAGIVLYLTYVLVSGASAIHMSGRFFSVPFVMASMTLVYSLNSRRLAGLLASIAIVFVMISDYASVKFGTRFYATNFDAPGVIDTKLAVYLEGAALLNYDPSKTPPNHDWYIQGLRFRDSEKRVEVFSTPGYFGFAAGPTKWIIDGMGLCDPLLARIPGTQHPNRKGGHYIREIPEGYRETVVSPGIHLTDPNLREYYRVLATITQGPIFTKRRFNYIWEMNLGRYDHLLEAYLRNRVRD